MKPCILGVVYYRIRSEALAEADSIKASRFWRNCNCPGHRGCDLQVGKPVNVSNVINPKRNIRKPASVKHLHACHGKCTLVCSGNTNVIMVWAWMFW